MDNHNVRAELISFLNNERLTTEDEFDKKTFSEWIDWLQGPEHKDFTVYHPVTNGRGELESIPYSFRGTMGAFLNGEDLMEFLRTSFCTREECDEWIKEQKPTGWSVQVKDRGKTVTYSEVSIFPDTAEVGDDLSPGKDVQEQKPWKVGENAYFAPDKETPIAEQEQRPGLEVSPNDASWNAFYQRGLNRGYELGLEDGRKEQKPVEKPDYSGLTEFERAIHRGFLCAGVENVPVEIIKETAKDCLAQVKPVEWSEEDEKMLKETLGSLRRYQLSMPNYQVELQMRWLKSLRPNQRKKNIGGPARIR